MHGPNPTTPQKRNQSGQQAQDRPEQVFHFNHFARDCKRGKQRPISFSRHRNCEFAMYRFHLPGFPAFRGVIFWQDFVQWRTGQNGFKNPSLPQRNGDTPAAASNLPPRAARLLLEAA
jgi:hypothetical protein